MNLRTGILTALLLWPAVAARATDAPDPANDPVVQAVQRVLPAVVNISTERIIARPVVDPFEEFWREFFGSPRRRAPEGVHSLGSGVIVDEDGWIVTNWHVVRRASKIHVVLVDGSRHEAQYVSGDEHNDLALLKIQTASPLPHVTIAGEREPLLGETVVAVGNPFGLEHTVTRGVISAKNREYTVGEVTFTDILQTDASINPGNSGGPLIDTRGRLVGINMAIHATGQGIGFAIPAQRVANLLAAWLSPEKIARVWLGLRYATEQGHILVADVQPGSPAERAGFKPRDRVVAIDGERFDDLLRMQRQLARRSPDQTVTFEIERDGRRQTVAVTLARLPKRSAPDLMRERFGLQIQPLTPDLAEAMGLRLAQGLIVADVEKGGPADEAGFGPGIVITHLSGQQIDSMDRLAERLADLRPGDVVSLVVFISERRGALTVQRTASVSLTAR
jgi:serine protease Do